MVKPRFDTNILIDDLSGNPAARAELNRFQDRAISVITWMEVLVGAPRAAAQQTRAWLGTFRVIDLDETVAEAAVSIRQSHRIKRPDAIVWATALVHDRLLVTRDTQDFPADDPGVRVPY
jgi:predicted nucleic acid-binding protein